MRDIPMFTTEHGVASLVLSQIPYTLKAYIRIQSSCDGNELLQECLSFCIAAGAEHIYATGHRVCEDYPEYTAILEMRADHSSIGESDAALFPVTEETIEQWREIYNKKVCHVPNGSWKTIGQAQELLKDGYFIHRNGKLLGIGKASGDKIQWIASCCPGAGAEVVRALCHALTEETITLEVASSNEKAIRLYEKLGFIRTKVLSKWYQVK